MSDANTEQSGSAKGIQSPAELELRDYFAASAMPALIGTPVTGHDTTADRLRDYRIFARRSYDLADAMLEARAK